MDRSLVLPPELWKLILKEATFFHDSYGVSSMERVMVKELCTVCKLFGTICQEILFQSLTVQISKGAWMHREGRSRCWTPETPPPEREEMAQPVEEWPTPSDSEWELWTSDIRRAIRSERRIALIARQQFLALQLRILKVHGYDHEPSEISTDPFQQVPDTRPLTQALFSKLVLFQITLAVELRGFSNLGQVDFHYLTLGHDLLEALDAHSTITHLSFRRCRLHEEHPPLASIKSFTFSEIPVDYRRISSPSQSRSQSPSDAVVPDRCARTSLFCLISSAGIVHLNITFNRSGGSPAAILQNLCEGRGLFQHLRELVLRFGTNHDPPSRDAIMGILKRTPALLHLRVYGETQPWASGNIPAECIPALERLECPLDWVQSLVPGRPVGQIVVQNRPVAGRQDWEAQDSHEFLATTYAELHVLLAPLALSSSIVSHLHLPSYPPLAPSWLLMPFISAHFPFLQNLECAIAGAKVAECAGVGYCSSCEWPPSYLEPHAQYSVPREVLDARVDQIHREVVASLSDRLENKESQPSSPRALSYKPERWILLADSSTPADGDPAFLSSFISTWIDVDLAAYFHEIDPTTRIPTRKPQTALHVIFFLMRGYYQLPGSVERIKLFLCFPDPEEDCGKLPPTPSGNSIQNMEVALNKLSVRYPALSTFITCDMRAFCESETFHKERVRAGRVTWRSV